MKNRFLGLGIGLTAAGILGLGISRIAGGSKRKNEQGKKVSVSKENEPIPEIIDKRPEIIECGNCGKAVSEYEFFCPSCGQPMEQICEGGDEQGGRTENRI
ncbi:MAG TPA: hypothetical protein PLN69_02160 [bacterium]|nr:hypothetical protein [bacterium]